MTTTTGCCRALVCIILASVGCRESPGSDPNVLATSNGDVPVSQAEQDRRIDYVEFTAGNLEEVKQFYSEVFGWEFTDYGPDYTSFNDGRLAGGFSKATDVTSGGPLVVLYARDLEKMEIQVSERGGKIVRQIFAFPGGRRFHFTDPSGNELAVWSDQ